MSPEATKRDMYEDESSIFESWVECNIGLTDLQGLASLTKISEMERSGSSLDTCMVVSVATLAAQVPEHLTVLCAS